MPPLTAQCPLCGSLHGVPFFDGAESEAVQCVTCHGWFHYVARAGKGAAFGVRVADRMNASP